MNLSDIKKLLLPFLEKNNIEIYNEGVRKKIRCLNPFHCEKNPSAQINNGASVHCYACGSVYDIFDIVQYFGLANDFKSALNYLKNEYNFDVDTDIKKEPKPVFRGHVRKANFVPLEFEAAKYEYRISIVKQRVLKAGIENPVFDGAWPFLSRDGLVNCVDFRFLDEHRKHIITAWYDGRTVKIKDPPNLIWGLDHIDYSKTALIVEGTKCASEAHDRLGKRYCVHTWNRGSNAAKYADWEPICGYKKVFLLADRDRKTDKHGNYPKKQIGQKAMEEISGTLKDGNEDIRCVVKEAPQCVEEIKKDGGDIIEMFQIMSIDDIVNFIEKGMNNE
jgi:hypothetical protein